MHIDLPASFSLGQIVSTGNAFDSLDHSEMLAALSRHARGDWGELCDDDKVLNNLALVDEGRLLSAYFDSRGTKFWMITEWDRSATTILLPEDY